MDKTSKISIKTVQGGEVSIWESEGLLIKDGESYMISYPDYASNTQTDNRLMIGQDKMRLSRQGAFTSDMLFEENMLTAGTYSVMFYNSEINVMTKKYSFKDEATRLHINIDYQIFDGDSEITSNEMEIVIEKMTD